MNAYEKIGVLIAMTAVGSYSTAHAGPLEELMPVPREVTARSGTVSGKALDDIRFAEAAVAGAPEAVADQAYVLEVTGEGVKVTASGRDGRLNARKTLGQLVKLGGGRVPACRIVDWPNLKWRGFMLDVGRNYLDLPSLKDMLDVMADYKLNFFHWHLTEYYAWRLQSKRYPQLAKGGFFDPFGWRHPGMFYSQEEFREIVDYAWERGITIVPEFDVPGHSEAFRRAFGFKTMRDEGVVETLVGLVEELCSLAPAEKMPFVHLGGDEVWDEQEKFPEGGMNRLARAVAAQGRTTMNWDPGQKLDPDVPRIGMLWGKDMPEGYPAIDARGWYIEDYDPFEVLGAAAYHSPFPGLGEDARKQGAVFCGWHDSVVGYPYAKTFAEQPVFPSCVLLGHLFWHGCRHEAEFVRKRLPLAGDPRLEVARDLERRTVAQRDKVLTNLRHPFHFVKQTQMRWRLTDEAGRLIAKDIAQGTVIVADGPKSKHNYYHSMTGLVYAETWVKSPDDRTVGAWIGFTAYDRDIGRTRAQGTPALGQWNRFDATIEINGERIAPPAWLQPRLGVGPQTPCVRYDYELEETPFTNDEWFMREPTRIRLRKGWNHVKLTLPMTRPVDTWMTHRWVGTFMPIAGTTDHPREIEDLEYSSDPQPGVK